VELTASEWSDKGILTEPALTDSASLGHRKSVRMTENVAVMDDAHALLL